VTTSTPPSDAWLRRVQALLAKAESTEFPAEAETLLAKAQELMTRHAIDDAMLRAADPTAHEPIDSDAVNVERPYAGPKAFLLGAVARANRCRMVVHGTERGPRRCVIVGHRGDIAAAKTMFTALSLHATRSMLAAAVPPWEGPRRFRHAFLLAFAVRIGERLAAAARVAEADAQQEAGGSVSLVLRDRSEAVDRAFQARFPNLRPMSSQGTSAAGVRSGRAAADRAALGQRPLGGDRHGLEAG
jgi:hypothetical protein